jgi:hypothetical protein
MNEPADPTPSTPLQQALQSPGGATLQQRHAQRLAALQAVQQARIAAGLAPDAYAQAQRLLAMLAAAQRQLAALPAAPEPARLLAAVPMTHFPSLHR